MEANKMERKGFGTSLVQLSAITLVASMNINAADFEFTPSVSATLNYVERVAESRESFFAGELAPKALLTYQSSNLSASATVNNRNIYRDASGDWTVTVYNDTDFMIRNAMERWNNGINDLVTNTGVSNPSDYQTDLFVEQLDRDDVVLKSYIFRNSFPTQLSAISLDVTTNNAIETFDITFKYQHFEASGVNF